MNDSDGADIDACSDTALASSQVLREVGVHGLPGSSHQAALVHHSQPREEEVWVEPIRNAPSPVAVQNRFAPLTDGGLRPTRRLVLAGVQDDTETLGSMPEVDHREPVASSEDDAELVAEGIPQRVESREEEVAVPVVRRSRAITRAFATLDEVNLEEVFRDRALVMKKPPAFLKGAYQGAVRLAMQEALSETRSEPSRTRAWKLFLLLPRILLFRQGRGGLMIPKNKLRERFAMFAESHWITLLRQGQAAATAHKAGALRRRHRQVDVEKRAERAQALVELGALQQGRHWREPHALLETTPRGLPSRIPPEGHQN